jgi:hypothetical protein
VETDFVDAFLKLFNLSVESFEFPPYVDPLGRTWYRGMLCVVGRLDGVWQFDGRGPNKDGKILLTPVGPPRRCGEYVEPYEMHMPDELVGNVNLRLALAVLVAEQRQVRGG